MVMVRDSIAACQFVTSEDPCGDGNSEIAAAKVEVDGKQLVLAAVYAPPKAATSVEPLARLLQEETVIVGGDLNAKNLKWGCHSTNPRGKWLIQAAELTGAIINAPEDSTTAPSRPGRRAEILDIFITKNVRGKKAETVHALDSDHFPVVMQLKPTAERRKLPTKKVIDWREFHELWDSYVPTPGLKIEESAYEMESWIKSSMDQATSTTQVTRRNALGLNQEDKDLIRLKNATKSRWKRSRREVDRSILAIYQSKVREMLLERREDGWNRLIEDCEGNPHDTLWRVLKRSRCRKDPNCPIADKNGRLVFDNAGRAELLADQYEKQTTNTMPLPKWRETRWNQRTESTSPEILEISEENLLEAIANIRPRKAPGPDGIPGIAYKHMPPEMVKTILELFNRILDERVYPKSWKRAITVTIPKKGKDPSKPENRRPISLISVLPKLFESIFLKIAKEETEKLNLVHPAQFGFTGGVGAVDQALHLAARIDNAKKSRKKVLVAFLDVEKAYDTAWRTAILGRMREAGTNEEVVSMLQEIMGNRSFRVRVGDTLSSEREMADGIPQGGPMSPFLFNILVGDLPEHVDAGKASIFQYADDIAVLVQGKTWLHCRSRMEKSLAKIADFCNRRRIRINPTKTEVVRFGNNMPRDRPILFMRKPVPIKRRATYLGIVFDWRLSWRPHVKNRAAVAKRDLSRMYRLLKNEKLSLNIKARVVKAVTEAQLRYGQELWAHDASCSTQPINAVQRRAMRLITGAPFYVTTDSLRRDLNMKDPRSRATEARDKRIQKLSQDSCPYRSEIAGLIQG